MSLEEQMGEITNQRERISELSCFVCFGEADQKSLEQSFGPIAPKLLFFVLRNKKFLGNIFGKFLSFVFS